MMKCRTISHCVIFFFSSRRRHTRFDCDWSSDVCSSDLLRTVAVNILADQLDFSKALREQLSYLADNFVRRAATLTATRVRDYAVCTKLIKIGRASCRERV